jgi:hypothetical protein
VRLQFMDIPEFHRSDTEMCEQFFSALAESEDMALFETTAVKKVIEYEWPMVMKYTIRRLFMPYMVFMVSFMLYIFWIFNQDANVYLETISVAVLALFSMYLLKNEIGQLTESGLEYFLSIWNYLDIVPPTLIIVFLLLDYTVDFFNMTDDKGVVLPYVITTKVSMQATMSLFIWLKFLYFLRIFDSTGYLIRIIIEVIIDMRHFLALLLLTFIAFGHAMYMISLGNEEPFIEGDFFYSIFYTYRMTLGDFDTTAFGNVATGYMTALFILCTVLNMIIMLNLLIAIISESFAKINEVSKQAGYQEKARIICENMLLVPDSVREQASPPNSYLLMAIDTQAELAETEVTMEKLFKDLTSEIKTQNKKMSKKIKKEFSKQTIQI